VRVNNAELPLARAAIELQLGFERWLETVWEITPNESASVYECFPFILPYNAHCALLKNSADKGHKNKMPTNRQSGFVNTAPLIAGNSAQPGLSVSFRHACVSMGWPI